MSYRLVQLCLVLAIVCGCRSSGRGRVGEKPCFLEGEIRSRTWDDPQGDRVRLLDWSVTKLSGFDDLLVVKFGPPTGLPTCLELYRVSHRPGGAFLSSDPVSRGSEPAAQANVVEVVPERTVFILLEHDYGPGIITSVKPEASGDEAIFRITREVQRPTGQREGVRYSLVCDKSYSVRHDLELGTWSVPEKADH
jgi:hypothetical protein